MRRLLTYLDTNTYGGVEGNWTPVQTTFNIENYLHDSQLMRLARKGITQSVIYHHHLFRSTVKQEEQLARSQSTNLSMNLKYLLISKYTVLARRLNQATISSQ